MNKWILYPDTTSILKGSPKAERGSQSKVAVEKQESEVICCGQHNQLGMCETNADFLTWLFNLALDKDRSP